MLETTPDSNLQCGQCRTNPTNVLLATAMVPVVTSRGVYNCRALLDSGSQASFITEACVQQLGLKRHHHDIHIDGIGKGTTTKANDMVDLIMKPENRNSLEVSAVILQRITKNLPILPVSILDWKQTNNRKLADPTFYIPGKIDLLLGADIFDQIVLEAKVRETESVFLRETVFGWIVSGCINSSNSSLDIKTFHAVLDTHDLSDN